MLEVVFARVHATTADELKKWMEELKDREDGVLETFRNEGTRHERVFLLEAADGPTMGKVLTARVEAEGLLNVCQTPAR